MLTVKIILKDGQTEEYEHCLTPLTMREEGALILETAGGAVYAFAAGEWKKVIGIPEKEDLEGV